MPQSLQSLNIVFIVFLGGTDIKNMIYGPYILSSNIKQEWPFSSVSLVRMELNLNLNNHLLRLKTSESVSRAV